MSAETEALYFNDNEEDTEDESEQPQVFFVPEIEQDEDLSGPPMDGTQYLQRVIAERNRCDAVVTKKVEIMPKKSSENQMLQFPEVQKRCSSEFSVNYETQMRMVSDFKKLRLTCEALREKIPKEKLQMLSKTLPSMTDEAGWLKIFSTTPKNSGETLDFPSSSIELCLAIPQPKMWEVLEYVEEWLTEGELGVPHMSMEDWVTEEELNVPKICQWVHLLLACVDLPLGQDLCAAMRAIVRALIVRRSKLEHPASEELPHINLIICIVGRYFNQLDLADPMGYDPMEYDPMEYDPMDSAF